MKIEIIFVFFFSQYNTKIIIQKNNKEKIKKKKKYHFTRDEFIFCNEVYSHRNL